MSILETVRVKREGGFGYRIINASSYDPEVHELVTDEDLGKPTGTQFQPGVEEKAKAAALATDFDAMDNEQLRDYIEQKTGNKVHPSTGRKTLLDRAKKA